MEVQQLDVLLRLIIAHLLADFVFQTDSMVQGKRKKGIKSPHFYWHLSIVGLLSYVLLADWSNWKVPLLIVLLHGAIDWLKIKINKDNILLFAADQGLHIVSIVFVWFIFSGNSLTGIIETQDFFKLDSKHLIVCIAYIITTLPSAILIGYLTKTWQKQLKKAKRESLRDAGKWIGVIERVLILTFIINNQWEPIGFLLAAKSVFRFGELKNDAEEKKTEYILIGTLMSFAFAIFTGILTQYLIK
ncbi:DUF3307 domain-containing protein [Fulvivirga sp.]|uniref:DUF3307 domain-containing protein n=1 Tax=Fulvivirga sp. TaxID=1931237 RepID=UPI0032EDE8C6